MILERMRPYLSGKVLDPFAGTGKLRSVYPDAYLNELEPEWAIQGPASTIGDALYLPYQSECFDVIATSPCYGNRMADHHKAKDASKRITYTHMMGRTLHKHNAGTLQWGDKYIKFHTLAWTECRRVLKKNGLFLLNVSDHIRNGAQARVGDWHLGWLLVNGFKRLETIEIKTPRMRRGSNHNLRVDYEYLFVMEKKW